MGEARLSGGLHRLDAHPVAPVPPAPSWSPRPPREAAVPGLVGPGHPELERAETRQGEAGPLLRLALALEAQGGEGTHLG